MEANLKSGSLITAYEALEQGKEVFALPGPVHQITSKGCHQLLREGATLIENATDVMEGLAPVIRQQAAGRRPHDDAGQEKLSLSGDLLPQDLNELESRILALISEKKPDWEQLLNALDVSGSKLVAAITRLELKGLLQRNEKGIFVLMNTPRIC